MKQNLNSKKEQTIRKVHLHSSDNVDKNCEGSEGVDKITTYDHRIIFSRIDQIGISYKFGYSILQLITIASNINERMRVVRVQTIFVNI